MRYNGSRTIILATQIMKGRVFAIVVFTGDFYHKMIPGYNSGWRVPLDAPKVV